jgi:hypothetical protein
MARKKTAGKFVQYSMANPMVEDLESVGDEMLFGRLPHIVQQTLKEVLKNPAFAVGKQAHNSTFWVYRKRGDTFAFAGVEYNDGDIVIYNDTIENKMFDSTNHRYISKSTKDPIRAAKIVESLVGTHNARLRGGDNFSNYERVADRHLSAVDVVVAEAGRALGFGVRVDNREAGMRLINTLHEAALRSGDYPLTGDEAVRMQKWADLYKEYTSIRKEVTLYSVTITRVIKDGDTTRQYVELNNEKREYRKQTFLNKEVAYDLTFLDVLPDWMHEKIAILSMAPAGEYVPDVGARFGSTRFVIEED